MTNSTLDRDIRSRIDVFLEELSSLVKQAALDSVRAALGSAATHTGSGQGLPRLKVKLGRTAKPAMSRGGKRSSEDVAAMAEKIAAFVRSNPGARIEGIATGLGMPSKELKLPVIKLLGSRALTKKGQKRGTQYFVAGGKRGKRK
jgi:hypothetical protein